MLCKMSSGNSLVTLLKSITRYLTSEFYACINSCQCPCLAGPDGDGRQSESIINIECRPDADQSYCDDELRCGDVTTDMSGLSLPH